MFRDFRSYQIQSQLSDSFQPAFFDTALAREEGGTCHLITARWRQKSVLPLASDDTCDGNSSFLLGGGVHWSPVTLVSVASLLLGEGESSDSPLDLLWSHPSRWTEMEGQALQVFSPLTPGRWENVVIRCWLPTWLSPTSCNWGIRGLCNTLT